MTLVWNEDYKTGVPVFDAQHKKLFASINKLYSSIDRLVIKEEFDKLLAEFIDYSVVHFQTEEMYFDKYGYPLTEEHELEHVAYKNKMDDFIKRVKNSDKLDLSFELVEYVEDWWVQHVLHTDHKYIPFFKEKGLVED